LAALPWTSQPGAVSIAWSGVLAGVAAILLWSNRPRTRAEEAPRDASHERTLVRLTHHQDERGDRLYAVEQIEGGQGRVLASGENPAAILERAFACAARAGTPLRPGWGLDREDIEALSRLSSARLGWQRLPRTTFVAPRRAGARTATATLLVVALVVLGVTTSGVLLGAGEVSVTSWALAVLGVSLPLGLAAVTATGTRLECSADRLTLLRTTLAVGLIDASFAVNDVLHVCATSPTGQFHKHLLLRTGSGITCIGCAEAARIVQTLHEDWKHTGGRAAN
jgi:hypothetical protein